MRFIQYNLWNGNDKFASIIKENIDTGDEQGS